MYQITFTAAVKGLTQKALSSEAEVTDAVFAMSTNALFLTAFKYDG